MTNMLDTAKNIVSKLQSEGHTSYFAGGCVRDMLLGDEPKDIDIATSATPDKVEKLFKHTIPVGKQFGIIVVIQEGNEFEIATFRNDGEYSDGRRPDTVEFSSPEEDAKRRDLTINGLFFDPVTEEIIDFVDGKKDIDAGIIDFIGNAQDRIEEDRLRILRAVRFAARFDFVMSDETVEAIKANAHRIGDVSVERIKAEMDKMFKASKPSIAFNMMHKLGIMEHVLPEVDALWDSEQSPKWHSEGAKVRKKIYMEEILIDENGRKYILGPEEDFNPNNKDHLDREKYELFFGNVGQHTMMVVDATREKTDDLATLWAALLHDVGKPATAVLKEDGNISNHGHDKLGAEMSEEIMRNMKASNKERELVVAMVKDHMKAGEAKKMKKSTLRRFVAQEHFGRLMLLFQSDCESSIPADKDRADNKLDGVHFLEGFVAKLKKEDSVALPEPFVSGKDLISLGLKPGPIFKEILEAVSNKQLDGEVSNKDEAIEFVKNMVGA